MKNNLLLAVKASIMAGEGILDIYKKDFEVEYKEDNSPLTEADRLGDEIIQNTLINTYPIISEESRSTPFEVRNKWNKCWLVDPLDGTKEFVKKNGEFTVNIALIENGKPILGVVYLPVTKLIYFGSESTGSYMIDSSTIIEEDIDEIISRAQKLSEISLPEIFTVVASRSHMSAETEDFINACKREYGEVQMVSKGSSIKLCLVAEGKANVYPRLAPTMEWDTAAAHAVAKYAGCSVLDYHTREELTYNKENLLNPHFIVVRK